MTRRSLARIADENALAWAIAPVVLVSLLALPFILHQNAWWEWNTPYWLLERQAAHVAAHGTPTLFLHTTAGMFNDYYVFYGGFTFSALAYPAALLGAWPVFAASCAVALAAGYFGAWWTARNLGASRRTAVLPGLVFVTTPYVLSVLYGASAWTEFVAVEAVAVMVGGITAAIWRPDRHRGWSLAALAGATAVLAGTHNLTLMLSAPILPLMVAALLPLRRPHGRSLVRSLATATLAMALGTGLTAAWLVPNLWMGPSTYIASDPKLNTKMITDYSEFAQTSNVLSPWLHVPDGLQGYSWLFAQPPVLAMAWTVITLGAVVVLRRRAAAGVLAAGAAIAALSVALLELIVHPQWWLRLPRLVQAVQFPTRVIPFVALAATIAVAFALVALPRGAARRVLLVALLAVVGIQIAQAISLVTTSPAQSIDKNPPLRHGDIRAETVPTSFASSGVVADYQFRVLRRPIGPRATTPARADLANIVTSDRSTLHGTGTVGEHRVTPVIWSPLVRFDGDVRASGRTSDGTVVVTIARTDSRGRWTATARPACSGLCLQALAGNAPWQMLAGRLASVLSAVLLVAALLADRLRSRPARLDRHAGWLWRSPPAKTTVARVAERR